MRKTILFSVLTCSAFALDSYAYQQASLDPVSRPSGRAQLTTVSHVIHISIDGLRVDALKVLLDDDVIGEFANFQRFLDEGATTFNARSDFTHTITLPNHTTMLTGRPVLQPALQSDTTHHGFTDNSGIGPTDTLHNLGNPNLSYVASVFDVVHDQGLSTALYASKVKFGLFDQSYDVLNGALDVTGQDDGQDKIDVFVEKSAGSPANAADMHADYILDMGVNHYNYSFLHYRDPDSAGHDYAWAGPEWIDAVKNVDLYLGEIFDLIDNDAVLRDNTSVILSSDHGGSGLGHSDSSNVNHYTVPFFVWGPGVAAGADLYNLNEGLRLDPGTDYPDYDAPQQPIRNGDGGNLALQMLGLAAIPGSTVNKSHDFVLSVDATVSVYGCGLNPAGSMSILSGTPTPGSTVVLGVDNPLGTQAVGSIPVVYLATAPDSSYPCGLSFPKFGMNGTGEILLDLSSTLQNSLIGSIWSGPGSPAAVNVLAPNTPGLLGVTVYAQGVLFDPTAAFGVKFGLTDAAALTIGL